MPLVYFHLYEGANMLRDHEGRHLAEDRLAHTALHEARALIGADALDGVINLDRAIQVVDHAEILLHELQFTEAVTIIPRSR